MRESDNATLSIPVSPFSDLTMGAVRFGGDACKLRFARPPRATSSAADRFSSLRMPFHLSIGRDVRNHLGRATTDLHDVDADCDPRCIPSRLETGSPSRSSPVRPRARSRARDLFAFGSRSRSVRRGLERFCRRSAAHRHVVGLQLPEKTGAIAAPSLVSGKAHWAHPRMRRQRKRAPGSRSIRRATSAFARVMRLGAMSRAYMLFEKSRTIAISRLVAGMRRVPTTEFRTCERTERERDRERKQERLSSHDDRFASKVARAPTSFGSPNRFSARTRAVDAKNERADEAEPHQSAADDDRKVPGKSSRSYAKRIYGNLRTTSKRDERFEHHQARRPGRAKMEKDLPSSAACASNFVLLERGPKIVCMLFSSARLCRLATNDSPPGLLRDRTSRAPGSPGSGRARNAAWPKRSFESLDLDLVAVAELHGEHFDALHLREMRGVLRDRPGQRWSRPSVSKNDRLRSRGRSPQVRDGRSRPASPIAVPLPSIKSRSIFLNERREQVVVERERRQHVRISAEDDDADAIGFTPRNEV